MPPRKPRKNHNPEKANEKNKKQPREELQVTENVRLRLRDVINNFSTSGQQYIELSNLSNEERKYIHHYAKRMGLKTRSYGKSPNRVLHVAVHQRIQPKTSCFLTVSVSLSRQLAEMAPRLRAQLSKLESQMAQQQQLPQHQQNWRVRGGRTIGVEGLLLNDAGQRMVPPRANRISAEMYRDKKELPIFAYQDEIQNMLQNHSIFIINGETGSGKTTQVPQYILNEAYRRNRACRIVVSEPRRVAAVASAYRVAEERGETVGETVGYQIRMESRVRKTTNLIYTTSGSLLRAIMSNSSHEIFFHKITHLIIDEIHERDKYTDFTLITVKQLLQSNTNFRCILMSATMDIQLLSKYFDDCPILTVPGQGYDVKIYHLEDVLFYTGYRTALMNKYLGSSPPATVSTFDSSDIDNNQVNRPVSLTDQYMQELIDNSLDSINAIVLRMKNNGHGVVYGADDELNELFDQLQYYIESEGVSVDVGHSRTGLTPLMAACQCNRPQYVRLFMMRQANVEIRDEFGCTAKDYAREPFISQPQGLNWDEGVDLNNENSCLYYLDSNVGEHVQQQRNVQNNALEKSRLLGAYQQQFNDDDDVDHDLILSLIEGLYRSTHPGAIMVFLPGYNDIVQQRDLIVSTLPSYTYRICILHGQMDSRDQFDAFQPTQVRKIILSTNIGQTSITIPDLAYIIDSGKVKMKHFDSITESSHLQSTWISQADANQRSGRAGRTQNGVCYRLYSRIRYEAMSQFCIAEFMRIPLTEICLYAKTLRGDIPVQTYLAQAIQPPSEFSVQKAIMKLQLLEVFNADESVTDLGRNLVDIPLDVQLGKCLLYSVYLCCFESVLTIVAFHSVKDPFVLPSDRSAQGQSSFQRKSFAGQSNSDQMGILALYKAYMAIRTNRKRCREFCNKYYLSQQAMEVFLATRRQIGDLVAHRFRIYHHTNVQNDDWNLVRLCLVAGLYPNLAKLDRVQSTLQSAAFGDGKLILQRTSALNPPGMKNLKEFVNALTHDWIIFYEKCCLGKGVCSINMNTVMPSLAILLMGGKDCEIKHLIAEVDEEEWHTDSDQGDEEADTTMATKSLYALLLEDERKEKERVERESRQPATISLDDSINFELQSLVDAEHLLLLRQTLRLQFCSFLRSGSGSGSGGGNRQNGAGSLNQGIAASCVQKLLNSERSFL